MAKEDEQGGGRDVRRMGQTLLEEQAVPPRDSLDSNVSPSTRHACMEIEIDFSLLAKGDYVESQYSHLGLTVSAAGGMDTRPRVFDTANPVDEYDCGDKDLGSPNMRCPGGTFPGKGEGGEPDGNGPNCNPLGNVLIVQDSDDTCLCDTKEGGHMAFEFNPPVEYVKNIGLLDVDYPSMVQTLFADKNGETRNANIMVPILGDNSYQLLPLNVEEVTGPVKKISLIMSRSVGVSSIAFCYQSTTTAVPPTSDITATIGATRTSSESLPPPATSNMFPVTNSPLATGSGDGDSASSEPSPSDSPNEAPSAAPTQTPRKAPSTSPTERPNQSTSLSPINLPSNSPTVSPNATPSKETMPSGCTVAEIDFNSLPDGTKLVGGDYLHEQFEPFYGLTFSVSGGLRNVPRLFDTAKVGTAAFGDPDLGSPNQHCVGGGPGMGNGGAPGPNGDNPYQNCNYLGNVLIIQEDNGYEDQPDDNQDGGTISFDFSPVAKEIYEIELLDIDYPVSITVVNMDDNGMMQEKPPLDVPLRGNNSLQKIALNEKNVVQLRLNLRRSGAVSSLSFCNAQVDAIPSPQGSESSPPIVLPTFSPTMAQPPTESETTPTPAVPTPAQTLAPTPDPTDAPTPMPTAFPMPQTTPAPIPLSTLAPTRSLTPKPTLQPTRALTPAPTTLPTPAPIPLSTPAPTPLPTPAPTPLSTLAPTRSPTPNPTPQPTTAPTPFPTPAPIPLSTLAPTRSPTPKPTPQPTRAPTPAPTPLPTPAPTPFPTPALMPPPTSSNVPRTTGKDHCMFPNSSLYISNHHFSYKITGRYGLQSSCFNNDASRYNICLDLTSTSRDGIFRPWMQTAIDAAARWEQVIIGDLPSKDTSGQAMPPRPSGLSESCTAYPNVIDDIYVCVQDVRMSNSLGFGGFYLTRDTGKINPRTGRSHRLTYGGYVGISNSILNDDGDDLKNLMIHELGHALGFPFFLEPEFDNVITASSSLYATNTNADDAWKALGCSGQIPLESNKGHWDEACLRNEVMTPVVFSGVRNPLSNFTIAAMADMGYDVNYNGADPYSIDDLGVCGTSCPEASSFRKRGLGSTNRRQLAEEEKMIIRNDFKDILRNYHNELEKSDFVQGEAGYYVMEKVDVLVKDDDGRIHTVTVTYDDVKEM